MPNNYLPPVITIPSALEIVAISQSFPMIVTTTMNSDQANTYISGQLVKLNVPNDYKMIQANGLQGQIVNVSGANISLNIDSTFFDAFVIPSSIKSIQPASLSPAGSRNLQFSNNTKQVPFQSLNNFGN